MLTQWPPCRSYAQWKIPACRAAPVPILWPPPVFRAALRRIFLRKPLNRCQFFRILLQNMHLSKHNNTPKICSVFLRNDFLPAGHAEGCLWVPFYCIQCMAAFRWMEIAPPAGVNVIERHSIGIPRRPLPTPEPPASWALPQKNFIFIKCLNHQDFSEQLQIGKKLSQATAVGV